MAGKRKQRFTVSGADRKTSIKLDYRLAAALDSESRTYASKGKVLSAALLLFLRLDLEQKHAALKAAAEFNADRGRSVA